jgi:hypothetical protein
MANTLDFDRYWAERQAQQGAEGGASPLSMTVLGKDYPLPPTLPAALALAYFRPVPEGQERASRSTREIIAAGESIFGRAALDEWALAGWQMDRVLVVVLTAERLILGETPDDLMEGLAGDAEGKKLSAGSTSSETGSA